MNYSTLFENFWLKYPAKPKGPKRKAYESWIKIGKAWAKDEGLDAPDEEAFSKHVARGRDAVLKNRKAAEIARQFVAPLPYATTFLNQYRFEDEFETSTGDLKRLDVERVCECGSTEVIGRNSAGGWICRPCHISEWKQGLWHMAYIPKLDALLEKNPKLKSESWREWSIRTLSSMPAGQALLARYP
jgi:ribosomal protein L37AE/L43A